MVICKRKEAGYRTSGGADPDGGHEDFQVLVALDIVSSRTFFIR